jgi:hypothetical protein
MKTSEGLADRQKRKRSTAAGGTFVPVWQVASRLTLEA